MNAREAIRLLNQPVMYIDDTKQRLDISSGVYKLSEIMQNWQLIEGKAKCATKFLITELNNSRASYWVNPETVMKYDGEVTPELENKVSGTMSLRERHERNKARIFGGAAESPEPERIKDIQKRTMSQLFETAGNQA